MSVRIAVDCMGGDHGFSVTVPAAVAFARRTPLMSRACSLAGRRIFNGRLQMQAWAVRLNWLAESMCNMRRSRLAWTSRPRRPCVTSATLP